MLEEEWDSPTWNLRFECYLDGMEAKLGIVGANSTVSHRK